MGSFDLLVEKISLQLQFIELNFIIHLIQTKLKSTYLDLQHNEHPMFKYLLLSIACLNNIYAIY